MIKQKAAKAAAGMVVLSFLCMGASNPFNFSTKDSLKERVESLEVENAKLQQEIIDLTAKLNVLTQRVNAQCGPGDAGTFNRDGINTSIVSPELPGLEVVRIHSKDAAPAADPSRGKLYVENSTLDNNSVSELSPTLPGTDYRPLPDPALTMSAESPSPGLAAPPAPPVASTPPATVSSPAPAAPNPNEAAAYDDIKKLADAGQSDQAKSLMESYLEAFPGGAHEDEVANWLGVVLYNQHDYSRAITVLRVVSDRHYESAVAPESLYYVGLCHLETGDTKAAGESFREVKILYPFSKAAQMAESKLASCCP